MKMSILKAKSRNNKNNDSQERKNIYIFAYKERQLASEKWTADLTLSKL